MRENRYDYYLNEFFSGNINGSSKFFAKNGYELENAYCKLLKDDLKSAKQSFFKLKDNDVRADFAYKIVNILQNNEFDFNSVDWTKMPKFFQLRNFLETDINILIKYNKGNYVEKLCQYSDIFANINSETYKYFSRVFFFNNYVDFALHFALKAKNFFYNDAELHYHLALIMLKQNNSAEAINYCKSCLRIADNYFPAERLMDKLMRQN